MTQKKAGKASKTTKKGTVRVTKKRGARAKIQDAETTTESDVQVTVQGDGPLADGVRQVMADEKHLRQYDLNGDPAPIPIDHEVKESHVFEADNFRVTVNQKLRDKWADTPKDHLRAAVNETMKPLPKVRALPRAQVEAELDALTERIAKWVYSGGSDS